MGVGGGGVVEGFWAFLGPPLQNFAEALFQTFKLYLESSAQELSIGTLSEEIGWKGGSGCMVKVASHMRAR